MKIIQEGFKELFYKKEITKNQNSFNVKSNYKYNIVWKNVIAMIYLHFGGLYGCFLFFKLHETAYTSFWCKYTYFNLFCINYWIIFHNNFRKLKKIQQYD